MDHPIIHTIGHSTHEMDEFLHMLREHRILAVADVRRYPRSRRFPHFNDVSLAMNLPRAGIEYMPFKSLGGKRLANVNSTNTSWRNESFRGYADYMQTHEFAEALEELIREAKRIPTVIMCAEALPWRCHRSLISDALIVRGLTVLDIMTAEIAKSRVMTPIAQVHSDRVTYPSPEPGLFGEKTPI